MSGEKDSGREDRDAQAPPEPSLSDVSDAKPSSSSTPDEESLRKVLEPMVKDLVDRSFQSSKDRGVNKALSGVEELKGAIGMLAKALPADVIEQYSKDIKDVQNQAMLEELYEKVNNSQQASRPASAGSDERSKAMNRVKDVFVKHGLVEDGEDVFNSRAYIEFYKANKDEWNSMDSMEFLSRAYDFTETGKSQTQVSPAAIAQAPAGRQQPAKEADMIAAYTNEMAENRGNKAGILSVQKKYREMGLDTSQIGFN